MTLASLFWGSPEWSLAAFVLAGIALLALVWSYWHAPSTAGVRVAAAVLKAVGFAILLILLVEPFLSRTRPRQGANVFALVADNSQSLSIRDEGSTDGRGAELRALLEAETAWRIRLGQDFDVRSYAFDNHLRAVEDYGTLTFDGNTTRLHNALTKLSARFHGLPVAGVLLFTDGNATDMDEVSWADLPPIYPVTVGRDQSPPDVSVSRVSVSQTNFESAPVVIRVDVSADGFDRNKVVAQLIDEDGNQLERQTVEATDADKPLSFRFQLRPDAAGISFYSVRAFAEAGEDPPDGDDTALEDATPANNSRVVVVDRGGGPYRVLYVCGRPNWEFKFMRRALADDDQIELVGLVRIAKREPKFTFRDRRDDSTNRLFGGFDHPDEETAEHHDQPVLMRLGTIDENELRDGFPKSADQLYRYHAVILDDVEAEFFSQDQLTLLQKFVSQRGGGFLMLGGPDSFASGGYRRTPIGDLLPVYLGQTQAAPSEAQYRMVLTREGWLQPWVRMRKTEPEERTRLSTMTTFGSLSMVGNIKPGATVLAQVTDEAGTSHPALVSQRFGKGHVASLLIGDLWKWTMRRENKDDIDLEKSWRQTVRWLVADVPRRVEVDTRRRPNSAVGAVDLIVRARGPEYLPLENARISIVVTGPDGRSVELDAEPSTKEAGTYMATYVARQSGQYRAMATVKAPDGSEIGQQETGWVAQPAADEFKRLRPNRELLARIAEKTGGQVVRIDDLDGFVASLAGRKAPIEEPWLYPLWHHPLLFLAAITCLVAEWGLRRVKGLA